MNTQEQPPPTRRARVREATREEIKALARTQMAASGTASLTLNAIARAMGMVPSALYRYFPDRDALITALIVDAFERLSVTLQAADAGRDYGARLLSAAGAYRRWALANPVDFQLVFGNPIPDYHAPSDQTGPAMQRVFAVFLNIINAAHAAGCLRPVQAFRLSVLAVCTPDDLFSTYPSLVMYSGLDGWATMHGVVTLELFGHLRNAVVDPEAFYTSHMLEYLERIGLSPGHA